MLCGPIFIRKRYETELCSVTFYFHPAGTLEYVKNTIDRIIGQVASLVWIIFVAYDEINWKLGDVW